MLTARKLADRLDHAMAELAEQRQRYEQSPSPFTMQAWDKAKDDLADVLADLKQWTLEP